MLNISSLSNKVPEDIKEFAREKITILPRANRMFRYLVNRSAGPIFRLYVSTLDAEHPIRR